MERGEPRLARGSLCPYWRIRPIEIIDWSRGHLSTTLKSLIKTALNAASHRPQFDLPGSCLSPPCFVCSISHLPSPCEVKMIGLFVALAGFLLCVLSLGLTESTMVRLVMVLAGIRVSFFGILMVNKAYQKNAVWKGGSGQ